MADNFSDYEKKLNAVARVCGWDIEFKYRISSFDGLKCTWTIEEYFATKDCETVVLEAPTPDALIELILMREGISRDRLYDSIGAIPTP